MSSIYMAPSDSISTITDESCFAEVRAGGNGDYYGSPEYDVGSGDGSDATLGRIMWDGDPSAPFDSGERPVMLHAYAGGGIGGIEWSAAGANDGGLTYDGASYGSISQVEIRAAVQQSNMKMTWDHLSVSFYKNGVLDETIAVPDGVSADSNGTDSSTQENVCTIVPTHSDDDEVIITGNVRLQCSDVNVLPVDNDIFGQVMIFSAGQ